MLGQIQLNIFSKKSENRFQDYESRRLVMNAACTDEPAVIGESIFKWWSDLGPNENIAAVSLSLYENVAVRPTSEEDVSVIVKAANDANMPISIRR